MDTQEHRYEKNNIDAFGFVHDLKKDSMISESPQPINNDDLIYRMDKRSIVGLMGLLPGDSPLEFSDDDIIEARLTYETQSVFQYLDKVEPAFNKIGSDAFTPLSLSNDWVGQLHGLLPGGTIYHNDDFFLPFANLEHQYDCLETSLMGIIDKVTTGDKVDAEAFKPLQLQNIEERKIVGLLGLLPGSSRLDSQLMQDEIQASHIETLAYSSAPVLDILEMIPTTSKINPEAYKSPQNVKNNGDLVGQLHGIKPDFDNKMQFLQFGYDELIEEELNNDIGVRSLGMLALVTESKTAGAVMYAAESSQDLFIYYTVTPNPTTSPTLI